VSGSRTVSLRKKKFECEKVYEKEKIVTHEVKKIILRKKIKMRLKFMEKKNI